VAIFPIPDNHEIPLFARHWPCSRLGCNPVGVGGRFARGYPQGSASRRNPGLKDEIPLGFPKTRFQSSRWISEGKDPPIIPGVLEGHGPIIALEFLGGHNPNYSIGISEWNVPRLSRGFWKGMAQPSRWDFWWECPQLFRWNFGMACPHNSVEISGGNNPNHLIGIFDGNNPKKYVEDGSIIDTMIPFRGSPKARQSFSPTVAASAATLGMGIAPGATLG
jgi:hypothetical protein